MKSQFLAKIFAAALAASLLITGIGIRYRDRVTAIEVGVPYPHPDMPIPPSLWGSQALAARLQEVGIGRPFTTDEKAADLRGVLQHSGVPIEMVLWVESARAAAKRNSPGPRHSPNNSPLISSMVEKLREELKHFDSMMIHHDQGVVFRNARVLWVGLGKLRGLHLHAFHMDGHHEIQKTGFIFLGHSGKPFDFDHVLAEPVGQNEFIPASMAVKSPSESELIMKALKGFIDPLPDYLKESFVEEPLFWLAQAIDGSPLFAMVKKSELDTRGLYTNPRTGRVFRLVFVGA